MNAIISAAIHHKRVVLSLLLVILLGGIVAYSSIPKEDNPDIAFPFFVISMRHEGISPQDAERLLIKPMEVQLRSLEGLDEMESTGFEGGANIELEFFPGIDIDNALTDVREAVDNARSDLPDETDEPIVREFNAAEFPIITVVLYGDAPERTLLRLADNLKDELESLSGVLEAEINGQREEVLEIIVDPIKLQAYDVSQAELANLVRANNRLVAAGSLDTGEGRFSVKVPGLFESARDVMELPVKTAGDGIVTLADITDVRRTFKDPSSLARFNGKPALTLDVTKRSGENTVETAEAVKEATRQLAQSWPGGAQFEFVGDQSVGVADFLDTLRNSVLSAVVLVAIVVVAALGWRTAALVGIAIPGSFLFGIMLLYFIGFTINTVVMFGLILSVGLLVDGAIVVSEYADRKMLEGHERAEAYRLAAQRMSWPIIASTLTTLAAFFPLLFWPDIIGEFMSFLPMTLILVLAGSLLMALIFLPTMGALIGRPGEGDPSVMEALAGNRKLDPRQLPGFTGWYARTLGVAIRHAGKISLLALAGLIGVWAAFVMQDRPQELFPDGEPDRARVLIHARGNLSIMDMDRIVRQAEAKVANLDGVEHISTRVGAGSGSSEDTIGRISLLFEDWDKRRPAKEIQADVRKLMSELPGVRVEFIEEQNGPFQGKDIQIEISSAVPSLIGPVVERMRQKLDGMEGLTDIEDSRPVAGIEWKLEVDRTEAGRYGTDVTTIGSFVQMVTNGSLMGKYRPDDAEDEVDIRVRFPQSERGITALDELRIQTPRGAVPVTNFVRRVARPNAGEIERVDGKRVMTLAANTAENVFAEQKVGELRQWLPAQNFDSRVNINFRGEDEESQKASSFLTTAFIIAIGLMALILLTQFNSFYNAGLILTAVILSTVGAVFGLLITGRPFVVIMTGVGIIALAGIVVNNNIVLIDTYDRLVKQGIEPLEAIIRTGAQRLRPVLLTTITTIIGLLPMVFQFNIDFLARAVVVGSPTAFIWVDLALAVVFGLGFATVLTLFITPSLLALRIHARNYVMRKFRGRRDRADTGPDRAPDRADAGDGSQAPSREAAE